MSTVLVISYHFSPESGTCSEKNIRIVKKLVESGYRVIVFTINVDSALEDNSKLYKIVRTKNGFFHKARAGNVGNVKTDADSVKSKIKKALSLAAIPDAVIDWFPISKKYIDNNIEVFKDVDIILSISSPYTAHLVSSYISKKIKKPFIMCYGDPWIYEPKRKRNVLRYRIEKGLERSLIRQSSGLLLITEWNKKKYGEIYNIPSDKIKTYLIGYDNDNDNVVEETRRTDCFCLLYGGSLDPIHRNIEPFLESLKEYDIYFEIRNNDFPKAKELIQKHEVSDKVKYYPLMNSEEFDRYQYSFDVLVLFGNKTPFQIPGKVFTYLKTNKKILYIKNNNDDDDGTEMVLKEYGNYVVAQNNQKDIKKALEYLITMQKGSKHQPSINPTKYSYHETMKPIVEMIEGVINSSSEKIKYE